MSRAWLAPALALVALLAAVGTTQASHLFSDLAGHTTLEKHVIGPDPSAGYAELGSEDANEDYVVRDGAENPLWPNAQPARVDHRRSLAYIGQLTDFQLADEESPARVEFTDREPTGFASSAWRPQEALQPFIVDWSIRQMNLFAPASPVPQGDGSRARMDMALLTGDQTDNMQRNETLWVRALLEGGAPLNFNSGSANPADYDPLDHPSCALYPPTAEHLAEALRYTGVQDYDDYPSAPSTYFYDPDDVQGAWATAGFPSYPGLMDRAQQLELAPAGLDVPSYVTNGNHEALVQGNQAATQAFEDIALGCAKPLSSSVPPQTNLPQPDGLDPSVLLTPTENMLVPPDPLRRFVDKRQIKAIYGENGVDDGHGYDFVDPAEDAASNGSASYYAWTPPEAPHFRFISIDTLSEGGVTSQSSSGNIDDPQFQWLKGELDQATEDDKLVVLFGHHPVGSLTADVADELPGPCAGPDHAHGDTPEHNHNPGCDIDTRVSEPIHLGQDEVSGDPRESLVELLDQYPHVLAYIAGHTHQNRVTPFTRQNGGVWWGIETAATADWPVQHRVIEVMDNHDGTLSIFGTVLDHAAEAAAPAPGPAQNFDAAMLASLGRELAYNDPQVGPGPTGGQGAAQDRNVELLVPDPRRFTGYVRPKGATPVLTSLVPAFAECTAPDRMHGGGISEDSCNPPSQESSTLTLGTPDANGRQANSSGFVRLDVCPVPGCAAGNVKIEALLTDVRNRSDLSDYGGELQGRVTLRITDRMNSPDNDEPATVVDTPFSFGMPCVTTLDAAVGSSCGTTTTANAVLPGAVQAGQRTIWELGQIGVRDGGPDGDIGTSPNTDFARQGVFVP